MSRSCEECEHYDPDFIDEVCWNCSPEFAREPSNFKRKPITNYDRIISKTPEELALFLSDVVDCGVCEEMHGFRMCDAAPGKACEDCWAGWLRQEVKEGE